MDGRISRLLISHLEQLVGYFGSPKFKAIDEATSRGLSLTDFAIHDQTKDTLFLVDVQSYAAAQKAAKKEKKKDKVRVVFTARALTSS